MPDYLEHQLERSVHFTPFFNGADCLVCVDLPATGEEEGRRWLTQYQADRNTPALSDADLTAAIVRKIREGLDRCPPNTKAKLQFIYHFGGGLVYNAGSPAMRHWRQRNSVRDALHELARADEQRVTKVYLAACSSHEHTDVVAAAFSIDPVTHVVTVDDTIGLQCGVLAGLGWDNLRSQPTFELTPIKVIVWEEENGRQIANVPVEPIPADQLFNINTNTAQLRSDPVTGACPTFEQLGGTVTRTIGHYYTVAEAEQAARNLVDDAAIGAARRAFDAYRCPNPHCQRKHLWQPHTSNVRVSSTWLSLDGLALSLFAMDLLYSATVTFDWTARVECTRR
jgi:hypothetical protein